MRRRLRSIVGGAILAFVGATVACGPGRGASAPKELQRLRAGTIDVVLLSLRDGLHHGKDAFIMEFRSAPDGRLMDVGDVRATASMPMAGMPMFGSVEVRRTDVAGRYAADGDFGMAGTWRMTVQWAGSTGEGSVSFAEAVQ